MRLDRRAAARQRGRGARSAAARSAERGWNPPSPAGSLSKIQFGWSTCRRGVRRGRAQWARSAEHRSAETEAHWLHPSPAGSLSEVLWGRSREREIALSQLGAEIDRDALLCWNVFLALSTERPPEEGLGILISTDFRNAAI